jgi:hypothetical protein
MSRSTAFIDMITKHAGVTESINVCRTYHGTAAEEAVG